MRKKWKISGRFWSIDDTALLCFGSNSSHHRRRKIMTIILEILIFFLEYNPPFHQLLHFSSIYPQRSKFSNLFSRFLKAKWLSSSAFGEIGDSSQQLHTLLIRYNHRSDECSGTNRKKTSKLFGRQTEVSFCQKMFRFQLLICFYHQVRLHTDS